MRKTDGAILTLTGYFNYGNVLQRYALQKFLKNRGYNFVSIVDGLSAPKDIYKVPKKSILKTSLKAIKRWLNYEKPYWYNPSVVDIYPEAKNQENLINFVNQNIWIKQFDENETFRNYIIGSDQVWRNWWHNREILGHYFLNFLGDRKANRISYAASFAEDEINKVMREDDINYIAPYIGKFNGISVREKSGIEMIKEAWGINDVTEVLDPTLLLDKSDYSELIEKTDTKFAQVQPIFTYILEETPEAVQFIRRISDYKRWAIGGIRAHAGSENDILPPVELWLKGFRDAKLVVTNSFHGLMFSIVNNTDFVLISKKAGGDARFLDFLSEFDLTDRLINEEKLDHFNVKDIKPIDWQSVNKKLNIKKQESINWLLDNIQV